MNPDSEQALQLANQVIVGLKAYKKTTVVLCPPYPYLLTIKQRLGDSAIFLGAQDVHWEKNGPRTGKVSVSMLASIGVRYVILGHSELRSYFHETDADIARKIKTASSVGINAIVCVGENLQQREQGDYESVVGQQIKNVLQDLNDTELSHVVFAYEPIWAIGTGKTASPEQAEKMHQYMKSQITNHYTQQPIYILYGGSMHSKNARQLLEQPNIDGGLIGGASLKPDDFCSIVEQAESLPSQMMQ